jgi:hypothetical protein
MGGSGLLPCAMLAAIRWTSLLGRLPARVASIAREASKSSQRMIFAAVHLFDLQLTVLCLNSNSQCVFAALVAAPSRWFFVVMTKKEGAMKALALLTAAALVSPQRRGLRTNLRRRQGQGPAAGCYQRLVWAIGDRPLCRSLFFWAGMSAFGCKADVRLD